VITGPTGFYTIMQQLVDATSAALTASAGDAVGRACVVPGAIAWDCCDVGLLAVTSVRQYLSDTFPHEHVAPLSATGGCEAAFVIAELAVEIVRCASSPSDNEVTVSCETLSADAQVLLSDAWVVLQTVTCQLQTLQNDNEVAAYLTRSQTFKGPAGGCVGSELRVTVALNR